ncbi:MAG TPA: hypothetical protein VFF28_04935 [Candidatus Nanoarchaeia archaeon]|nr:hypothetical protein [Candidatus Nanoarchaeia archaeon]
MDKNKQTTALIIIAVALIAALGYIGLDSYNERKAQEQLNVYQNGLQAGYTQAILQLMQQASTCQQVPIMFQNQSLNIIAVECLKEK